MAGNGQKRAARPDVVKVGNHMYNIEWLSLDEWEARHFDEGNDASTHSTVQKVYIMLHKDAQESHYQEVLWHELTHAVWDSTMLTHVTLGDVDEPEERVIMHQSPGQVALLKENPDLVAYLMSDGTEVRT